MSSLPQQRAILPSKYKEAGFFDVVESTIIDVADQVVLCHHLPYFDPEDIDQRYPEFKPNDEGGWLLHGHVHERWKIRKSTNKCWELMSGIITRWR